MKFQFVAASLVLFLVSGVCMAASKTIKCIVTDARTSNGIPQTLILNFDDRVGGKQILADNLMLSYLPQTIIEAPGNKTVKGALELDAYNGKAGPMSMVGTGEILNVNFLASADPMMKFSVSCGIQ